LLIRIFLLCINETSIIADVIAALRLIIFVGRKLVGGNIASENSELTLWPNKCFHAENYIK
jgi:hypothetical protein